jgi:hypothetical protein
MPVKRDPDAQDPHAAAVDRVLALVRLEETQPPDWCDFDADCIAKAREAVENRPKLVEEVAELRKTLREAHADYDLGRERRRADIREIHVLASQLTIVDSLNYGDHEEDARCGRVIRRAVKLLATIACIADELD